MIRFTVPGQPQGKARPRVVSRGGYTHAYTPTKTAQYEACVREAYKLSIPPRKPPSGAVEVAIRAYYAVPKSWPLEKRKKALAGMIPVTVKPDCDNIIKIICDALNGLAWEDDKQIIWAQVSKAYGAEPRVEVEIWES